MRRTGPYRTIQSPASGIYKEKGSRFIALAFPVSSSEPVKQIIHDLRKEHHGARHHCYAYRLADARQTCRQSDDGEPANTAGKPILAQIDSFGLHDVLVVVVRYFGGTLLGVGGLTRAYKKAAAESLENAVKITREAEQLYQITFPYQAMDQVMQIIKSDSLTISDQQEDNTCHLEVLIPGSKVNRVLRQFESKPEINVHQKETDNQ